MHTLFDDPQARAEDAARQAIARAQARPAVTVPAFDEFWAAWPKREAKKDARRAWDKLTAANKRVALTALPAHIARWRREGRARNHIPHPATWLNGERWDDELGEIFAARAAGAPVPPELPWPCTWSGIVAKGLELGLSHASDEFAPAFKIRVFAAAGVDDALRAQILADYGVRI